MQAGVPVKIYTVFIWVAVKVGGRTSSPGSLASPNVHERDKINIDSIIKNAGCVGALPA